jgi:hypothetical protein
LLPRGSACLAFFFVARDAFINLLSRHVAFLPQSASARLIREIGEGARFEHHRTPRGDRRDIARSHR